MEKIQKLAILWLFTCLFAPASHGGEPEAATVLTSMRRVADWQIAQGNEPPPNALLPKQYRAGSWVHAVFWDGLSALDDLTPRHDYLAAIESNAQSLHWEYLPRINHADDSAMLLSFLHAYRANPRSEVLMPTMKRLDAMMAEVAAGHAGGTFTTESYHWNWCDALFMEPPALAALSAITRDPKYLDFVNREWPKTSRALFDPEENLYFRDARYLSKRESNGKKIFWARGNGWVFAGYSLLLEHVPKSDPARAAYESEFRAMAKALLAAQQPDGFWHASLLDPAAYPQPESSSTGLITTGLAYGLNAGLLDPTTYRAPTLKAWQALNTCVESDGKLTHAQPVGGDPQHFAESNHEPYAAGAFLLAGAQIYQLAGGRSAAVRAVPTPPH